MDVEALEWVGVAALRKATHSGLLVVVDEIGKMELYSKAFREAVSEALEQGDKLLVAIMLASNPWVDRAKRDSRVRALMLARDNRETVFRETLTWL